MIERRPAHPPLNDGIEDLPPHVPTVSELADEIIQNNRQ